MFYCLYFSRYCIINFMQTIPLLVINRIFFIMMYYSITIIIISIVPKTKEYNNSNTN
nr:MAG TPA: hypothetical protein [Caudoviricetes sp.]